MNSLIIILGATGDLARKKIFPALYQLFARGALEHSYIIGAALEQMSNEQFLVHIKKFVQKVDDAVWHSFAAHVAYHPINFSQEQDFDALAVLVKKIEEKHALSGSRLVYCSTAPFFYCTITQGLAKSGLLERMEDHPSIRQPTLCELRPTTQGERKEIPFVVSASEASISNHDGIFHRIVYEKPFGHDLESAHAINECIAAHFDERQIYRIDHYLTKELVGNIALVRFTNIVFEPLWNNRYIDQVQIVFDEPGGIEGRGAFYDKYGALADVMQNHMMQLVALIGMESPQKLSGDYIRTERANVLKKIKVVDAIVGQYKGYTKEAGVDPQSSTETFAQVMLRIENPRWAGVPFYLKTGKCLDKKETAIYIKFKQIDCLLTKSACPSASNSLAIEISPDPSFILSLNAKRPGKSEEVMPVQMACMHPAFGTSISEAYETLFEEILKGEQSVAVRFDEIEYAWKVVEAIRALKPPMHQYECGSAGPAKEQAHFETKHGFSWLTPKKKKEPQ